MRKYKKARFYSFKQRSKFVLYLMMSLSGLLFYKLYVLQISESEKYSLLSDKNRIRIYPILPKRGKIITYDNVVIAKNKQIYRLWMESCDEKIFNENMNILENYIYIDEREKIFLTNKKSPKYKPILIKDNLSWDEYAKIAMILFKLKYVSIDVIYTRLYSFPYAFSNITGYTSIFGDVFGMPMGKIGIENICNDDMSGIIGHRQVETNAFGKKMRTLSKDSAINGNDIRLTINSELQKYIYNLIIKEKAGACVVLDVDSGRIISLVSAPGFNPNMLAEKISQEKWNALANDKMYPMLNRAISGVYPPGSIFKIVTAFAALSENIITPDEKIICEGHIILNTNKFHCWKRNGHGPISMVDAISKSCDCYFFEIAMRLGIDKIMKYAKDFGFGEKIGVELPGENAGLVPSKMWKLLKYGQSWKPYETIITGIGQGAMLSTILQTATLFGKLYSNNYNYKPHLLADKVYEKSDISKIDQTKSNIIKQALYNVCNKGGSASKRCKTHYGISGKTGSSQVRKLKENEAGINKELIKWKERDHAFFVGSAPFKKPKYIVAVMIEHGGWGSAVAAPIAKKIFDKLMDIKP